MTQPAGGGDDYDIFSAAYRNDPFPQWAALRSRCPIARSDLWGGSWMPLRYEDIRDIARDAERFSNRSTEVAGPPSAAARLLLPPLTSDPPEHKSDRDMLVPFFSQKKAAALEPFIRERSRALVGDIAAAGGGDAIAGFAQTLTLDVLIRVLGVAPDTPLAQWLIRMIRLGGKDQSVRAETVREILSYLGGLVDRVADPPSGDDGDDLITYLAGAEIGGTPLSRRQKVGTAFMVLLAGADTTWSALGAGLWHLALVPSDRRRLGADPSLTENATEEFLRAFTPVNVGRLANTDVEIHGRCIRANQRVLLNYGAANRDPDVFDDPDRVRLDRADNHRHLAFGAGPHRCLGSNIARLQIKVGLEEWLRLIPEFHLSDPGAIDWTGAQVRGPDRLDITVDR
ncbi:MAG: cytochrome P450 [Acidimicrobiia bacterium]